MPIVLPPCTRVDHLLVLSAKQGLNLHNIRDDGVLDYLNDCSEDYDCKRLSTKRLNEVFPIFLSKALNELGISKADFNKTDNDDWVDKIENEMLNYEQEIFDEIIKLHPNMKKKS